MQKKLFIYFAMESGSSLLAMRSDSGGIAMPVKPGLMKPAQGLKHTAGPH